MNRPSWIAPLYGYVVCLVAVITFIISVSSFVDAAFDRANPLQGRGGAFGPMGASLTSFEAFQATMNERERMVTRGPGGEVVRADTLTTAQQRARFEALRADRIAQVSFSASQRLVKHGLLILLALALFVTHWRWAQRQRETPAT